MSCIIRVRGKRRNREQYATELAERRKRARSSLVHDKQDDTERALSRLERLPLELLEVIFTHSRNLSLLSVSHHMRYLLDRETFINKFIVRLFQETGIYDDDNISLFCDSSDAARCLNTFLLYPHFDSSFILRYTRDLLLDRANVILREWIESQSCIPTEEVSNHLKSMGFHFDVNLGLVDTAGVKPQHGRNEILDYLQDEASNNIGQYDYELTGDRETIRISPGLTSFSVHKITKNDNIASALPLGRNISIHRWPCKPDMWANLMPQLFTQAPFTQSKGNYLKLMLDLCPDSLTDEHSRVPLDQLSSGFAEALEFGCGPAIYCLGSRILDFTRIKWSSTVEFATEENLSAANAVTGPRMNSKEHTDSPWQYLIGESGSSKKKKPIIHVEAKHITACLKGFHFSPDVYYSILDTCIAHRFDKLENEISTMMYTVAQKQEPRMKVKLLDLWKRWVGLPNLL